MTKQTKHKNTDTVQHGETSLQPNLRFPEFTGDWEYLNGNVLFEPVSNKNHNSDLPILAITQEQGAVPRDQIDYTVIATEKSIASYKVVEKGDFIISLRSFQGGIEYSYFKGICSPAYIILRPKVEIDDDFYKCFFKSYLFIQDLNKNLEGIRDGKMVSYKQFSDILLPFPCVSEQQKIASCLSSLDARMEAETEKLQTLKTHKKGLMQNLFQQNGETSPNLRFPEFSGEWEEKTLGEVCHLQAGKFVQASEILENQTENLFSCFGGNGLRGYTKSFTHDGIFPLVGRQGALCGNVQIANGKFHATEHALVATAKEKIDNIWLYFILNFLNLNQFATGQAQPGLSVDNLNKVNLQVPKNLAEQQKIASCLSALDAVIAAQGEKIELLKQHKKGLMQQLFPNPAS